MNDICKGRMQELDIRFTYHAPKDGQPEKYTRIRDMAREFAVMMERLCPASGVEKERALTKIEEAVMRANAAIARREGL